MFSLVGCGCVSCHWPCSRSLCLEIEAATTTTTTAKQQRERNYLYFNTIATSRSFCLGRGPRLLLLLHVVAGSRLQPSIPPEVASSGSLAGEQGWLGADLLVSHSPSQWQLTFWFSMPAMKATANSNSGGLPPGAIRRAQGRLAPLSTVIAGLMVCSTT